MAMAPCKCLILLALLLSFFFITATATATARSFGVMESDRYESGEKSHDSRFKPSEDGVLPEPEEVGDLGEMDYTPPRKKPPIHN